MSSHFEQAQLLKAQRTTLILDDIKEVRWWISSLTERFMGLKRGRLTSQKSLT